MKKIIPWATVAFCVQFGVANAALFVENFDSLDPTTDTIGSGSTILGGQGQLEDITGTTWSGRDTNTGNLQTRVLGTGDRNLNIYTHADATMPQINNTATFTAQGQADVFGLYFNLESWGTDNNGAGQDNFLGRTEVGVRDSAGSNVFGIEMVAKWKDPTTLFAVLYDYTSGTRTQVGTETSAVKGGTVGSLSFSYDGAGNITLNIFAGADQTGTVLQTVSGTTDGSAFTADSLYVRASAPNTAKNRIQNVQIDDLTVIPEPTTLSLIAVIAGGLLIVRRRRFTF